MATAFLFKRAQDALRRGLGVLGRFGMLGGLWMLGAALARTIRDHFVDDSVFDRLRRVHKKIAVGVLLDPLETLAGMIGQDVVEDLAQPQRFARLDFDVGRLALE